jgi:lichenan operon transcriptional antiterminator
MEKRYYKILSILKDSDNYVTAETLSASCLVSTKTILKDIKSLNIEMKPSTNYIEVIPSHGIKLIINDIERFHSLYYSFDNTIHTVIEREEWIEKCLIENNSWVKADDLCGQLFISSSGLSQNLKAVRKLLLKYDLRLVQRPHYGMRVEGREFNKRLCLGQIYISHIDQREDFPGSQFTGDELSMINKIADIVDQILIAYQISMSEVSFQNLVIDIYVSLKRIQKGIILKTTDQMILDVARWSDSVAAVEMASLIEKNLHIEMKDQEIVGLSIHIASKRIIRHFDESIHRIIKDYDVNHIVNQMIDHIKEKWDIDFSKDEALRSRLALHLIPLEVRSRYNVTLQNPLLTEIKQHNMLAYQLAVTACEQLTDYHGNRIAEEEIGYIALHINLSLLELKMKWKRNVLVVSGLGSGTAHTLAYQIQELYGKYISSIKTTDYIELRKYDLSNIDLLISSIPLKQEYPVPTVAVRYFLSESDQKTIEMYLHHEKPFHMKNYIDPKLFVTRIKAQTKEEALAVLARRVSSKKSVYQEMLANNQIANAEVDHMTALLSTRIHSGETRLLIGITEKPIVWNEKRVQLIFLPLIAGPVNSEIQKFYDELSALVLNPEYIKRILKDRSFAETLSIFETLESQNE